MIAVSRFAVLLLSASSCLMVSHAFVPARWGVTPQRVMLDYASVQRSITLLSSTADSSEPTTFREAEVLGLKLMQEGQYEQALKSMYESSFVCISKRKHRCLTDHFVFASRVCHLNLCI